MAAWNAHRFYFEPEQVSGGRVRLSEEEAHHALQVLRLRAGDRIILLDGRRGVYEAVIEKADRGARTLVAALGQRLPDCEAQTRVTLFQGIPKSGKLEWLVQKCTELGVDAIQPVRRKRCVAEQERNPEKNLARLQRVAREAAKQCCRGEVPRIYAAEPLAALEERLRGFDCLLVPWEEAEGCVRIADALAGKAARTIGVVIGPEGGMTAEEAQGLSALGGRLVTLGPRILRTETAGMAALASIFTVTGDF